MKIFLLILIVLMLQACQTRHKTMAQTDKNETRMEKMEQIKEEIPVVGIALRIQAMEDVEVLWNKFWTTSIGDKLTNKASDDIYAVYSDYETDHAGPYTLTIGYPVSSLTNIPQNLAIVSIPTGAYRKYISKGKMPDAIIDTWKEIWDDQSLQRAYRTDFTIHGKKYFDGDNAEVETFISIKQ